MAADSSLELFRATEVELPFVMATERLDGYEELVGRWDEARHRAALSDGRHAYFVAEIAKQPIGFAIVRDWASPEKVTLIKRIAVCDPNRGHGRALLGALVEPSSTERMPIACGLACFQKTFAVAAPMKPLASWLKAWLAAAPILAAATATN